eukprot:gene11922-12066_t
MPPPTGAEVWHNTLTVVVIDPKRQRGGGASKPANEAAAGRSGSGEPQLLAELKVPENAGRQDALPTLGLGSLWNVANAVTSVIKQTTDEVVRSVQETDWKNELAAFTHVVEAEAQKAVEVVQHLPQQVARTSESGSTPKAHSSGGAEVGSPMMPFGVVGASLAEFGKQLISGTKEVLDTVTDMVEGELAMAAKEVPRFAAGGAVSRTGSSSAAARLASRQRTSIKYSRFEAEVAAMQRDSATYCDEPEDIEEYGTWRGSWSMEQAQADIDKILTGNAFMAELQSRIVPLLVEKEDFWARYFYRCVLSYHLYTAGSSRALMQSAVNKCIATETASDGSSATHGGAAHWTLVTDTAATAATQQHSAPEQQKATNPGSQLRQSRESGVSQQTPSSSPQAAASLDDAGGTSVSNAGAAAPAPVASALPAFEHEDEDDENWGDEDLGAAAASIDNSTADKQAVGKTSRTATAGKEEEEDWGNWD